MSKIIRASIVLNDAKSPSPCSGRLLVESIGTETLTVTDIEAFGFVFAQTSGSIAAGTGAEFPFSTASYVGGTRTVTITSDKTEGSALPNCTIPRNSDNVTVIPDEEASMEPTIQDFYNEVDALMRVDYPPARVDDILADKANGEGATAFTAYLAAREQARTDARATLGYYPITATPAEGSIAAAGGTKSVAVAATGDFTVECPTGCSAAPASGTSATTEVVITAEENTDPVARSFGVVFRSGNCTSTANIPQDAAVAGDCVPSGGASATPTDVCVNFFGTPTTFTFYAYESNHNTYGPAYRYNAGAESVYYYVDYNDWMDTNRIYTYSVSCGAC